MRMRMTSSRTISLLLLAAALASFPAARAQAYIERVYSLEEVLAESNHVLLGRIEKVEGAKRLVIAALERALKGKLEYRRVKMNIGLGPGDQAEYLIKRLRPGEPLVLFYQRDGESIQALAHAADTWFQLFATHQGDTEKVWWRFTHLEVYMGRTYDGGTAALATLTADAIAGRRALPAPDPKVPKLDIRKPRGRVSDSQPAGAAAAAAATGGAASSTAAVASWTVAVPRAAPWKLLKGTRPAPESWRESGFDDASWAGGAAPFGYGDPPFGTALDDMEKTVGKAAARPGYTTLYLRKSFEVADPERVAAAEVAVDYDDGFVLWLNGKEALAANGPAGARPFDAVAPAQHESGAYEAFAIEDPRRLLVRGRNTVAVQVFNASPTSSDLKLDLELKLGAGKAGAGGFRRLVDLAAPSGEARGIACADFDGDEKLDLFFSRGERSLLLVNEGGGFRERAADLGIAAGARAAAWADHDGDGHLDLLTNAFGLFTAAGGGLRDDSQLLSPPAAARRNPEGAGWIDFDGNGLPDILITNGEHGILLLENPAGGGGGAGGGFRDVSARAGLGPGGFGAGNGDFVAFSDYDGDGYTDFLYNLGSGVLARNQGDGTFRLDREAGVEIPGASAEKAEKRGAAFADFDADGDLDLFIPAPGKAGDAARPRLYRNENDGTFRNVLEEAGDLAAIPGGSFSAVWGDVMNDGSLDLFVCFASGSSRLYAGDGAGRFRDLTEETAGLDGLAPAYGAALADLDEDGDLDLALNLERKVVVALNELAVRPGSGSLEVRVGARRGAVGCVVRLEGEKGRPLGLRELGLAEGAGGQAPPRAHFGAAPGMYRVSVALSDGRVAARAVEVKGPGTVITLNDKDFSE
jgi:hypothetical protein